MQIRFLVMDVDGTLTDGRINMGESGESYKSFNVKDGCGIKDVLPGLGIKPVIITARSSCILENRCRELNIEELHQGSRDKLKTLNEILEKEDADLSAVAYAGDDLIDIPCMEAVKKAGGIVLAPADAIPEIKTIANFVSGYRAGDGAVRDCINYLIAEKKQSAEDRVEEAIEWILAGKFDDSGVLPDGSTYTIQEYMTKPEEECVLESHRYHIDILYMIEGHERFRSYTANCLTNTGNYNSEKDTDYWQGGIVANDSVLVPGSLVVVYNGQPHKGAIVHRRSERIRKLVYKVEV